MKRLAALIAAACGLAAGLCSAAISAQAASVTLTPEQTRALFGDRIPISYWNGTEYVTDVLVYHTTGIVQTNKNVYYKEAYWYDNSGAPCLIYRLQTQDSFGNQLVQNDGNTAYTISLNPIIDISNINEIRFSLGLSSGMGYPSATAYGMRGTSYSKSLFTFLSDYNSEIEELHSYNVASRDTGSGNTYPMQSYITPADANTDEYLVNEAPRYSYDNVSAPVCAFTTYQCNLVSNTKKWSWIMNGDIGATGLTQSTMVLPVAPYTTRQTAYKTICFYITCPYISEDYVHPEEVPDAPEYADDFQTVNTNLGEILTALDAIAANQDRAYNLMTYAAADLNLISQYVYGMSQDVHSIAGALGEDSLLDIGASHASFNSALDDAARSFDSMAANDLPQNIQNASNGVMSYVWSVIRTLHLDAVFGILVMLFIVHFIIFRRG